MDAMAELASELIGVFRSWRDVAVAMASGSAGRAPLELTAAAILHQVSESEPVRLSALAEALRLDLSTVSRQVPQLEDAGWLLRSLDPSDRRAQLVHMTPAGTAWLQERRREHAQVLADALGQWRKEDVAALAARLHSLSKDLDAHHTVLSARAGRGRQRAGTRAE